MDVSLEYVAIPVVFGILWRAWRARGGRGVAPTRKEWEGLRGQIPTLDRNAAHLSTLSVTTRRVLSLILGSRAERPRIEAIPNAIALLDGFGDAVSRQLQAFSTMAVMTGLCATAIVFARTFQYINSPDSLPLLLPRVSSVYMVNFVAIFVAILIYGLRIRWRKQNDGVVELAIDVLSELEDIPKLEPDAAILAAALQQQHEHFERWSSGFFDRQLGSIQRLVEQVSFLSTGIQRLVGELISSRGEEEHKTDLAVQEMASTLAVSFERLDSRLDAGLRLLAQPFLQGLPGLEGLQKAAEALQAQDLAETIDRFTVAADRTSAAVEKLPAGFDAALSGVSAAVAQGTGSAVDAALRSAGAETQRPLLASLSVLEASLSTANEGFRQASSDIVEALHAGDIRGPVAALRVSVDAAGLAVADLPTSFKAALNSVPDAVASGSGAAVGAAVRSAGRELQQPLLERLTSVEAAVAMAATQLNRSAGELRDTMQLDRLFESVAQLSGSVNSIGERVEALPGEMRRSLATLPEELSGRTQMAVESALRSAAAELREPLQTEVHQTNTAMVDLKSAIERLSDVLEEQRSRSVSAPSTPPPLTPTLRPTLPPDYAQGSPSTGPRSGPAESPLADSRPLASPEQQFPAREPRPISDRPTARSEPAASPPADSGPPISSEQPLLARDPGPISGRRTAPGSEAAESPWADSSPLTSTERPFRAHPPEPTPATQPKLEPPNRRQEAPPTPPTAAENLTEGTWRQRFVKLFGRG